MRRRTRDLDAAAVVVPTEHAGKVDPMRAAALVLHAAKRLESAGYTLVLLPPSVQVKTRRRRWWHRNTNRGGSP